MVLGKKKKRGGQKERSGGGREHIEERCDRKRER